MKSENKVINFYETDKPYGCFSNFAKYPIEIQGKIWPTSEHYFQAQKFEGTEHEEQIRLARTPMEAARMGRERFRPLRSDWEEIKLAIMKEAVKAKIQQHETVRDILLSTGNCVLVEHTKNDEFWGDNGDGTGQNMLGKILMEIRAEYGSQTRV
ncbi:Swarming motility protein YbiA [Paenibacillus pectinilyticus]|uniref:Swarming motility protein YbiA n=2 Tax=Paenibacillus pectinilyticus TaxID=512399 RepID=A0A1C0ZU00_9BACL|nr:Swarming motility protein YbiA [Paenibacillus pectinilyticus]